MAGLIRLQNVTRSYASETAAPVTALDDVSVEIGAKEFVAITGPSGCGKSTLLHLLGGLDKPTRGEIHVGDLALHLADERALTRYRRHDLGIVFQFFNLLPTMNLLENVSLPLLLQGEAPEQIRPRALELLELVGLSQRATHFVHQLSGGELQRTAIARALIHRPKLLLADEPTGNLDTKTGDEIMALFARLHAEGNTIILVTHENDIARRANRIIHVRDGKVETDELVAH
jgi:putative ABC transport system ATP-binding protein